MWILWGKCAKNLTKVQVDRICCSPLISKPVISSQKLISLVKRDYPLGGSYTLHFFEQLLKLDKV